LRDYTGSSPQEAQACALQKSALHRDDAEEFAKWWEELRKSGKPGQTEARLRRADGEFRWFQISTVPVHDEQGRLRWYGINTDIDERRRAEEALRSSEQNLRLMVDSIPGHVCTFTPDGQLELANRYSSRYSARRLMR